MASLYLDHDVAVRLVPSLAARGHSVRHARDEGQARAGDEAILLYAARQGWILVTHNRADFRLLHAAELEPVLDHVLRAAPSLTGTLHEWTRTDGWRQQVVG